MKAKMLVIFEFNLRPGITYTESYYRMSDVISDGSDRV